MNLPSLDEGVILSSGDKVICHCLAIHQRHSNLIRRLLILKHLPTNAIKIPYLNTPNIQHNAPMLNQQRAPQEIRRMRSCIRPVQRPLDKRLRQQLGGDKLERMVGRAGDGVEDADGPRGVVDAHPGEDVANAPRGHGGEAGVPVGPDVLLGCDGVVLREGGEDLGVWAGVVWGDGFELGEELIGDGEV